MNATDVQHLIDKYGLPAYTAAMRQVYINAIENVVWMVVWLAFAFVVFKAGRWLWKRGVVNSTKGSYSDMDGEMQRTFGAILTFLAIAPMFAVAYLITQVLEAVLNPQWQAIQMLASLLPR